MKKTLLLFTLILTLCLTCVWMAACGDNSTTSPSASTEAPGTSKEPVQTAAEIRILGLKGPTGMGMASIINTAENDSTSPYRVTIFNSPDLVKAEILLGAYDIAALPTNVAAALYSTKKADLQIAAVNTLGVLYLVENGNTVTDIQSLKGKTIYSAGGGSTPEFVLRYLLTQNGIDPDNDVTLDFSFSEHSEAAAYLSMDKPAVVMLPEPNVTTALNNIENARVALNLTEEWSKVSDSALMQGCIVVRREFAEKYPEQLMQFLDDYRSSVNFVNTNPAAAAELISAAGIIPAKAVAEKAIPRCNIVYVEGTEMKTKLDGFLQVLFDAAPTSIGGKMPDEGFYYQK